MTEFLELSRLFCKYQAVMRWPMHVQQKLLRVNHTKQVPFLVFVAVSVVRGGKTVVVSADSETGQTK